MRIEEALSQVRSLQWQLMRNECYCCYRSATIAASGVLAVAVATVQPYWVARPMEQLGRYLALWIGVAGLSMVVTGGEILARYRASDSAHARRQTIAAVRQFAPCVVAGALFTWGLAAFAPQHAALLPAIWSVLFSMGVFASSPFLPKGSVAVALYYLAAGLVCLRWGQVDQALKPWTMLVPFALGQWLTAVVLYRQQERCDDRA
jgi:hypothetical protein